MTVPTGPDGPLVDTTLADEIALLGDLMAAAAAADRVLTEAEVDAALGLSDPPPPSGE
jgi:hypothetical protein